jgi:hypothetical protein
VATQMDVERLRAEALRLSGRSGLRLATQLLESLDERLPENLARPPARESPLPRAGEIDCGALGSIPAGKILDNARADGARDGMHLGTSKS